MKKIIFAFFITLAFLSINKSFAQTPADYTFSSSIGTYTPITGGTMLVNGTSLMDSWVSTAITIPSFTFCGAVYTTAYVTSNGQISLGGSAPSTTSYTGISTGVGSGICICPFSADLNRATTTASSEIRWETIGNEIIFQWQQITRYAATENFDMQARLNTANGSITFVYNLNSGPGTSTSYQPQVGIRTSATTYSNRLVASGAENWDTSLPGTVNTSTCRFTATAPAKNFTSGLTYVWTSPTCLSPTNLMVSGITMNGGNLSWNAPLMGSPLGYEWKIVTQGSGSGATAVESGTTIHPTVTASSSALSASTAYDLFVRTDCGAGDYSNWAGPYSFTTLCGAMTAPYYQNFDGVAAPNIPNCWNKQVVFTGGTPNVQTSTTTPNSAPNCAQLYNSTAAGAGTHLLLIAPQFSDLPSQTTQIRFWARFTGGGTGFLNVGTMSDPSNPATFTSFQAIMTLTGTWQEFVIPFSTYAGTNEFIAFKHGLGLTNQYIYIDNFVYETIPTCPQPSVLMATNITDVSADLNWTPNGSETSWNIEYGPAGFTLGTGTMVNGVGTHPYTLSGLSAASNFSFYVQADCGGGDLSSWSGPYSFTTLCGIISSFPWLEQMNTYVPNCWSETAGQLLPTTVVSGTTSNWIADGFANVGTTGSARLNIYSTGRYDWLMTPQINLGTGAIQYQLEFDLALTDYGNSNPITSDPNGTTGVDDKFAVVISTDGGTTWSSANTLRLWDNAGSTYVYNSLTPAGTHVIIPLTSYTGVVMIGFYGESTVSNADNDLFVDNVRIIVQPLCPQPLNLSASNITSTSADLAWMAGGSEILWDIQYGVTGFALGTGTIINNVTTNSYSLTGLNSSTTYQYYVLSQCSPTDSSLWSGPYSFATACGVINAPFEEHFNTTTIPLCWTMTGTQAWLFTNTWPDYGALPIRNTDHSGTGGSYAGVDGSGTVSLTGINLFTPFINTSPLTTPQVRFFLFNNNTNNTDYQTLSVDVYDGAAWNNGMFIWGSTQNSATWQEITIPLNTLTITGPIQVRFSVAKSAGSPFYDDLVIDDVYVEEAPTCLKPTALTASNVLDVSADLSWTTANGETMWDIQYGPTGFVLGTGTIINNVNSNPYTLTGLTATTSYQYYVLAQCSPTDSSIWNGPYTFVTQMTICSGTPTPGTITSSVNPVCPGVNFTLVVSGYSIAGGINFQWQSSLDGITYTDITGATNDTITMSQLDTTYYHCIVTCVGSGLFDTTSYIIVNTNSFQNCYCTSNATNAADEEIFNVTVGTLNNTSTCSTVAGPGSILNEYSNFTGITPPDLSRATSVPFSVQINTCGTTNYNSGVAIFIDFNQNGLFTDPGEKVYTNGALANVTCIPATTLSGTITIPLSANLGITRMRVIDTEGTAGNNIVPCGTYGYGETEDYFVNITAAPSCIPPTSLGATSVIDVSANLGWTAQGSETEWDIQWGLNGFTLGTGTIINNVTTNSYFLTGLTSSTTYQFYVLAQCSPTDSSTWAGPFTFTTSCAIYPIPFIEQFNTTSMPNCWSISGPQNWLFTTSWPAYGAAGITEHTANGGSFAGVDGSGTTLLTGITLMSPLVDVGTATAMELQFWLFNNNIDDASYQTLRVDYYDGASWNNGVFLWNSTSNNPAWQHIIVDLASYTVTGPVQFRFVVDKSSGSPYYDDIMIDDILLWEKPQFDLSVIEWVAPSSGCALSSTESVTIKITNVGAATQSNFLVGYTINGGVSGVPGTVPGPLAPGDTITYTFTTTADFSAPGTYPCGAAIIDPGDQFNFNDTVYASIISQPIISTFPYTDGFESNTFWYQDGIKSTWAKGTPAGTNIIGASSGTEAWMTNLTGNYQNSENSYVVSPCFDFTSLSVPMIELDINYYTQASFDGATLQASTDGGLTWSNVGALNDPVNWFNDNSVDGLAYAGTTLGWSGNSTGWKTAKHELNGLGGQSDVKLRIAFGSDATTNSYDGFAFDNVFIYEKPNNDMEMISITAPLSSCGLTATEYITVVATNVGVSPMSNIAIGFSINGGITFSSPEYIAGPVNPGDTITYTFTTAADFSIAGVYDVIATFMDPTDQFLFNDSAYTQITNIPTISSFPYYDDFEGVNFWNSGGSLNSWVNATPAGSVIIGASSGTHAWITGVTGSYSNNENSYVISPCFDFSTLTNPFVRLKQWTNAENSWDGAVLQSSIDGGATWQNVGAMNDPTNWYNDNSISGLAYTGLQEGWTGTTSTGWTASQHSLLSLAGQSSVKFRMAFGADGSVNSYDGFAFDDFEIFDAADLAVVYPLDGTYNECGMTSSYVLSMCIQNMGSSLIPSGSNIFAWYQVNNGTPVADTIILASDLLPNDSVCINFSQPYDFSATTSYLVDYWISYNGDSNNSNDSSYTTIVNYSIYVNILGGDTILVDPLFMPYTLSVQASPFTYDSYSWSNFDGTATGILNTFDTPDFGWYYLTVTDGACTATDSVFVDMLSGLQNNILANSITVYPNPTDGKFNLTIQNNLKTDFIIELYASDGKKVIERKYLNVSELNEEFDGSHLAEGLYSLKIISDGKTMIYKVAIY